VEKVAGFGKGKGSVQENINFPKTRTASHGVNPTHIQLHINDRAIDLLIIIFTYCLPDEEFPELSVCLVARMLLCRICGLWRTLASSMSNLWCPFEILLEDNLDAS
jgi:hypothetical protein